MEGSDIITTSGPPSLALSWSECKAYADATTDLVWSGNTSWSVPPQGCYASPNQFGDDMVYFNTFASGVDCSLDRYCIQLSCHDAIENEDWYQYCHELEDKMQPVLFKDCNSVESFCPAKTIPSYCKNMVDYTDGVDVSEKLNRSYEFDKKQYPFLITAEDYRTPHASLEHDAAEQNFNFFINKHGKLKTGSVQYYSPDRSVAICDAWEESVSRDECEHAATELGFTYTGTSLFQTGTHVKSGCFKDGNTLYYFDNIHKEENYKTVSSYSYTGRNFFCKRIIYTDYKLDASFCSAHKNRYPVIDYVRENKEYLCNGVITNDKNCSGVFEDSPGTFYKPFEVVCPNSETEFKTYEEALQARGANCKVVEKIFNNNTADTDGKGDIDLVCKLIDNKFPKCEPAKACDFNPCSADHVCSSDGLMATCTTSGQLNSTCLAGQFVDRPSFDSYRCEITFTETEECPIDVSFNTNYPKYCKDNNPIVSYVESMGNSQNVSISIDKYIRFEFKATDAVLTGTRLEFGDAITIYIRQGQIQLNEAQSLQACPVTNINCHDDWAYVPDQWYTLELEIVGNQVKMTRKDTGLTLTKSLLSSAPITSVVTEPGQSVVQYRYISVEKDIPSPHSCTYAACNLDVNYRDICSDIMRNIDYPLTLLPKHDILDTCSTLHASSRLQNTFSYDINKDIYSLLDWDLYCAFYDALTIDKYTLVTTGAPSSSLTKEQCQEYASFVNLSFEDLQIQFQVFEAKGCLKQTTKVAWNPSETSTQPCSTLRDNLGCVEFKNLPKFTDVENYTQCMPYVDPMDGNKTCIDNALVHDWSTTCSELNDALIPDSIQKACPNRCYNHLLSLDRDFCTDRDEIFSDNTKVKDTCSTDWYDYCLKDSKGTLTGKCSAVECDCDTEQYEGISGQSCEIHCPVGFDGSACAEASGMGACRYSVAQQEQYARGTTDDEGNVIAFDSQFALEGECECFLSEGTRNCDIECRDCNNNTYGTSYIEVVTGVPDLSVSLEECKIYAGNKWKYTGSWASDPTGCFREPFNVNTNSVFYNLVSTSVSCSSNDKCIQKSNARGQIGICDTTRGACQCLPPFTDINFYNETDWRGKVIEKNERVYNDGDVTGRDLYRIRQMQGKESFIRNALQVLNVTNSRIVFTTSGTDHFVYNGQNDPDISLCQFYPYTIYHDHNEDMRIVKGEDCDNKGCSDGKWITLPSNFERDFVSTQDTTHTFFKSGTYYYMSTVAPDMVGKITVATCTGTPAYTGGEKWEKMYGRFLDNPGDFWCFDRRCSGGDVNSLGSLDESSSRYNYDCNSLCPGFDNITQLSCSKRGRCGATGQCVCDTASVITGTDDKGVKKVIQIQPGVEIVNTDLTITALDRTGYRGDDCSIVCPGYDEDTKDMTTICNGHGTCDLAGECACEVGYIGDQCQFRCPTSDGTSLCNGHGTCDLAEVNIRIDTYNGTSTGCELFANVAQCEGYAILNDIPVIDVAGIYEIGENEICNRITAKQCELWGTVQELYYSYTGEIIDPTKPLGCILNRDTNAIQFNKETSIANTVECGIDYNCLCQKTKPDIMYCKINEDNVLIHEMGGSEYTSTNGRWLVDSYEDKIQLKLTPGATDYPLSRIACAKYSCSLGTCTVANAESQFIIDNFEVSSTAVGDSDKPCAAENACAVLCDNDPSCTGYYAKNGYEASLPAEAGCGTQCFSKSDCETKCNADINCKGWVSFMTKANYFKTCTIWECLFYETSFNSLTGVQRECGRYGWLERSSPLCGYAQYQRYEYGSEYCFSTTYYEDTYKKGNEFYYGSTVFSGSTTVKKMKVSRAAEWGNFAEVTSSSSLPTGCVKINDQIKWVHAGNNTASPSTYTEATSGPPDLSLSQNDCQAYAASIGKWGSSGHWSADPKGCFHQTSNDKVYYNTHSGTACNSGDRCIQKNNWDILEYDLYLSGLKTDCSNDVNCLGIQEDPPGTNQWHKITSSLYLIQGSGNAYGPVPYFSEGYKCSNCAGSIFIPETYSISDATNICSGLARADPNAVAFTIKIVPDGGAYYCCKSTDCRSWVEQESNYRSYSLFPVVSGDKTRRFVKNPANLCIKPEASKIEAKSQAPVLKSLRANNDLCKYIITSGTCPIAPNADDCKRYNGKYTEYNEGQPPTMSSDQCLQYANSIGASFAININNPGPGCVVTTDKAHVRYNPGVCKHPTAYYQSDSGTPDLSVMDATECQAYANATSGLTWGTTGVVSRSDIVKGCSYWIGNNVVVYNTLGGVDCGTIGHNCIQKHTHYYKTDEPNSFYYSGGYGCPAGNYLLQPNGNYYCQSCNRYLISCGSTYYCKTGNSGCGSEFSRIATSTVESGTIFNGPDMSMSEAECQEYGESIGEWGGVVSLSNEIKGCYYITGNLSPKVWYNTDSTSVADCSLAERSCIQKVAACECSTSNICIGTTNLVNMPDRPGGCYMDGTQYKYNTNAGSGCSATHPCVCKTDTYLDKNTNRCVSFDKEPIIDVRLYLDQGKPYETTKDIDCQVNSATKITCAQCNCFDSLVYGKWAGFECETCAKGYGKSQCRELCADYDGENSKSMCGGFGKCLFGSEMADEFNRVFQEANCVCGQDDQYQARTQNRDIIATYPFDKPKTLYFYSQMRTNGVLYDTFDDAKEECNKFNDLTMANIGGYCYGIFILNMGNPKYEIAMGVVGSQFQTYYQFYDKTLTGSTSTEYQINTKELSQTIVGMGSYKACKAEIDLVNSGIDTCNHFSNEIKSCDKCASGWSGKNCRLKCNKCLFKGECNQVPSDKLVSQCSCPSGSGLWGYQCCPSGFMVPDLINWNSISDDKLDQIKLTSIYDGNTNNELDAGFHCKKCPGISDIDWLEPAATHKVCSGSSRGTCVSNNNKLECECKIHPPSGSTWKGRACSCHDSIATPYSSNIINQETTDYGCLIPTGGTGVCPEPSTGEGNIFYFIPPKWFYLYSDSTREFRSCSSPTSSGFTCIIGVSGDPAIKITGNWLDDTLYQHEDEANSDSVFIIDSASSARSNKPFSGRVAKEIFVTSSDFQGFTGQGPCTSDSDCKGTLICFNRTGTGAGKDGYNVDAVSPTFKFCAEATDAKIGCDPLLRTSRDMWLNMDDDYGYLMTTCGYLNIPQAECTISNTNLQNFVSAITYWDGEKFKTADQGYYLPMIADGNGNYIIHRQQFPCPVGTYGPENTVYQYYNNVRFCAKCKHNTYQDEEGQTECKACPSGKKHSYLGRTSATECATCPAGKQIDTVPYDDGTYCKECPVGQYSDDGSECKECAKGQYSGGSGKSTCTNCDAGKYTTGTGTYYSADCKNCGSTQYNLLEADNNYAEYKYKDSGYGNYEVMVTKGQCEAYATYKGLTWQGTEQC